MNKRHYTRVPRDNNAGGSRSASNGSYAKRGASRTGPQDRDRELANDRQPEGGMTWKKMDLHIHTPASSDYRDPGISYLDILKKADEKGLNMIAFADHNTVGGYAAMHRDIETLTLLEKLNRMSDDERVTLSEYRRLLAKIVVLPAFEFTATFGFHILGVFPENTSIRKLEYLLLDLNVPEDKMLAGAPDVGHSSDVLRAYQVISAAGGLAIAAHANSSNGVAMQGFPLGGQTKIAYTQDPNLIALEVTDLDGGGRRTTASFFNGSKPEYPRRMHLMQGSDAHSLETEQADSVNKRLGVGGRITDIFVREASFAALKEILSGTDFTRLRPHRAMSQWDFAERARAEGPNIVQSFHERALSKTSRTRPILHDIAAFANTQGGTLYIGVNPDPNVAVHGVERAEDDVRLLRMDVQQTIEPPLEIQFDVKPAGPRAVLVVTVPEGTDTPYVYNPTGQIFVREEDETALATRDEIIGLVLKASGAQIKETRTSARGRAKTPAPVIAEVPASVPVPVAAQPAAKASLVPTVPESGRWQQREEGSGAVAAPSNTRRLTESEVQPERVGRAPAFVNLPPEKIKGRTQPMLPRREAASAATVDRVDSVEPPAAEQVTTPLNTAQLEQYLENVTGKLDENSVGAKSGRSRGRKAQQPQAEAVAPPVEPVEAAPAPAAEQSTTSRRGRGRRKEAEASAPATPVLETPVMEATVSSEHKTREEIVREAADKPKRGRRRSSAAQAQLEIDAPTSAAAASFAGQQAILVEAEIEPGAQIPAELSSSKSRSRRGRGAKAQAEVAPTLVVEAVPTEQPAPKTSRRGRKKAAEELAVLIDFEPPAPPNTGVQIVATEQRPGGYYHTMRDLRNRSTVHNVTRQSARRLWHYAILQHEHGDPAVSDVAWHPELPMGIWRRGQRAGDMRYDLVSRHPDGALDVYYGVTEEGLHGPWAELVHMAEQAGYFGPDPSET